MGSNGNAGDGGLGNEVETSAKDSVLLLSGGMDSTAIAFEHRPSQAIFINYGQRPASAEERSARAVCNALSIDFSALRIDLSSIAAGLLASDSQLDGSPSPEWWPFRNQLLISVAAGWAIGHTSALARPGSVQILIGSVKGDGDRHADGTEGFVRSISDLIVLQEGAISVLAPFLERTTEQLIDDSRVPDSILAWTHSCHVADVPCGSCPGCFKRQRVLNSIDRLK